MVVKYLNGVLASCFVFIGLWFWVDALEAQQKEELPYALRGTYAVGVMDVTLQEGDYPLDVTIWYPAQNPENAEEIATYSVSGLEFTGQALRDALPDTSQAPYPVIYYSHGLGGTRLESTYYTEHLASWGFVVIATDHKGSAFFNITSADDVVQSFGYRPLEIMRLIQYSETLNATDTFQNVLDMQRLAVTGFSFGGYTALTTSGASLNSEALATSCLNTPVEENALCDEASLQLLAEAAGLETVPTDSWQVVTDRRIQAVIPLAPCCVDFIGANALSGITAPLMVMAGTDDTVAPPESNGLFAYENSPSPAKAIVLIERAGHDIYVGSYTGPIRRAHDLVKHFATAFLLTHLTNDENAATALDPDQVNITEVDYRASGNP
jgi:predicted dienelactone hydrolase